VKRNGQPREFSEEKLSYEIFDYAQVNLLPQYIFIIKTIEND
jgi:hypothetical protein